MTTHEHENGTTCLEGTRRVPEGYVPCRAIFESHLSTCVVDIRYEWWVSSTCWMICIPDGGSSGLRIYFCPHCGRQL